MGEEDEDELKLETFILLSLKSTRRRQQRVKKSPVEGGLDREKTHRF